MDYYEWKRVGIIQDESEQPILDILCDYPERNIKIRLVLESTSSSLHKFQFHKRFFMNSRIFVYVISGGISVIQDLNLF